MPDPCHILDSLLRGEANLRDKLADLKAQWRLFGFAVRKSRAARGYSQKAFAIDLGVSAQMLAMMESGGRPWTPARAEKAVHLLKRPEQWPDQGRAIYLGKIKWAKGPKPGETMQCDGYKITQAPRAHHY